MAEISVTTDDLMSVQQAAEALGKPRVTIYRWIAKRDMLSLRLGGILYVPKSEVDRMAKEGDGKKSRGTPEIPPPGSQGKPRVSDDGAAGL